MVCSKTYHFTWIMHEQQITATTFILNTFRATYIHKWFIIIELHSKCHLSTFRRQHISAILYSHPNGVLMYKGYIYIYIYIVKSLILYTAC